MRNLLSSILLLCGLFAVPLAAAPPKGDAAAPTAKNEFAAKAPSNYLPLPKMHIAVVMDANRAFRALELEAWLLPKDEENLALIRTAKKAIKEAVQEDFSNYDWEAFRDPDNGPKIAKRIVTAAVERVSGGKLEDVLIKTLVLH